MRNRAVTTTVILLAALVLGACSTMTVSTDYDRAASFAAYKTFDFIPAEEWSDARHRRGLWGERVAMAFLTSCGWYIEAHRFRLGHRDVDLVTRRGAVVAFVEVKTRRSTAWGASSESVSWRKRRRIARVSTTTSGWTWSSASASARPSLRST